MKIKKKKKIIGKKRLKIKTKKRVGILRAKKTLRQTQGKNKIKDSNPDIIFDSTIGETNTLFVSKPSQISFTRQNFAKQNLGGQDGEISEGKPEKNILQKIQEIIFNKKI